MISDVDRLPEAPRPVLGPDHPGQEPGDVATRLVELAFELPARLERAQAPGQDLPREELLAPRERRRASSSTASARARSWTSDCSSRRCRATARAASRRSARTVSPVSRTSGWAATWVPLIFIPPSVNGGGVSTSGPIEGQGECQLQTAEKEGEAGAGVGAGHHPVGVSRQSGEARERPIGSGRRARTSCSGGGTGRRSSRGAPPPPAGCPPRPRARCAAGPSRRPAPSGRRCPGSARSR